MSATKLVSRYAKSLLDLAIEKKMLNEVHADMVGIQKALGNRDFLLLMKSPVVNPLKKTTIVDKIFDGKVTPITNYFLDILIRKHREAYLPEVVSSFLEQYRQYNHIVTAKITTAVPLDDTLLAEVKRIILADTGQTEVSLKSEIDPSIIGGFILEFGDKLYDNSVAHKLDKLKQGFMVNKYVREF